jgi:hypothetical protein
MSAALSRRNMLALLGTAGAVAGLPAGAGFVGQQFAPVLELADAGLLALRPELVATVFGGRVPEAVGPELVRAWRDGLRLRIIEAGRAAVLVRFDQLVLLRGLAREEGLHFAARPLGRGAFHVRIARRA